MSIVNVSSMKVDLTKLKKENLIKYAKTKGISLKMSMKKDIMLKKVQENKNLKPKYDLNELSKTQLLKYAKNKLITVNSSMQKSQILNVLKSNSPNLVCKFTPKSGVTSYIGSIFEEYIQYMYLAMKRKNVYTVLLDPVIHDRYLELMMIDRYGFLYNTIKHVFTTYVSKKNIKDFYKTSCQFLLLPLVLTRQTGANHANLILINRKTKTFEFFEPHGFSNPTKFANAKRISRNISSYLTSIGLIIENIELVGPHAAGMQAYNSSELSKVKKGDPGGFCQAWSGWFADYRLKNPDTNASELLQLAIKKVAANPKGFKHFIRNYAEFVVKTFNDFLPFCNHTLLTRFPSIECRNNMKMFHLKVLKERNSK